MSTGPVLDGWECGQRLALWKHLVSGLTRIISTAITQNAADGLDICFDEYNHHDSLRSVRTQRELATWKAIFNTKAIRSKPIYLQNYFIELDPNNLKSFISNSLLFQTQNDFPWICPSVVDILLWAISNSHYFKIFIISSKSLK